MGQFRIACMRRRSLPVVVGAVLALGLAACSSGGSSGGASGNSTGAAGGQCSNIPSGPIHIANIAPLSGPTASSGQLTGMESDLAVAYFNAHDSVCGHKFVVTNYNDKGDPATSLGIARQLVSQGNVIIVNDSFSSAQNQIQPYLMQQHALVVNGDGAFALFNAKENPTAFSTELAADAQADAKAAGLRFIKMITYSPTAIDLTTPLTQARDAGIQTLFPTGFTGVPAMVSGLKQINWSPKIVGWGGLNAYGVTAAQVPPGTVDGCTVSYTQGEPTSKVLTPQNTALLESLKAKIGVTPQTPGILGGYFNLLAIKHAIETANSLDGAKLATALSATSNLSTNVPGITLNWTATPDVHNGFPSSGLKECTLKPGPYDILYAAS